MDMTAMAPSAAPPSGVAVIGGGAAGAFLALQLAARGIRSHVFDTRGAFARGLAYSATAPWHRLNVPLEKIGAAEPGGRSSFAEWYRQTHSPDFRAYGDHFVPRGAYGDWLAEQLEGAVTAGWTQLRIGTVVALEEDGHCVRLITADGASHSAAFATLCLGNQAPRPLLTDLPAHYVGDIWAPGAFEAIAPSDTVLIVGTGSTALDAMLDLVHRGHRGRIVMLSRRALMPIVDAPPEAHVLSRPVDTGAVKVRAVLRHLRQEAAIARGAGISWQAVIDAFRHDLAEVWQAMPDAEKQRFLRHLRPWWLVHRHRLAPDIAALVEELRGSGRLTVIRGRLGAVARSGNALVAEIAMRNGANLALPVNWLINCTGPEEDYRRIDSPLVRDLFTSGTARPGAFNIGLDVDGDGRLIGADGRSRHRLHALGVATRSRFGEVTSAPQIRTRAIALAKVIAAAGRDPALASGSSGSADGRARPGGMPAAMAVNRPGSED